MKFVGLQEINLSWVMFSVAVWGDGGGEGAEGGVGWEGDEEGKEERLG